MPACYAGMARALRFRCCLRLLMLTAIRRWRCYLYAMLFFALRVDIAAA